MAGDARTVLHRDATELLGVNDRWALAQANKILQARILERHARAGVTFLNPTARSSSTASRSRRRDDRSRCRAPRHDAHLERRGDRARRRRRRQRDRRGAEILAGSVIEHSRVGPHAVVGPMAHVKEHADIGSDTTIGTSSR
jgi:bifunctional UDP-N-acetylglucosamine pyrophosphorylase/glucosamine-1-phosphate N-acetyltransferase